MNTLTIDTTNSDIRMNSLPLVQVVVTEFPITSWKDYKFHEELIASFFGSRLVEWEKSDEQSLYECAKHAFFAQIFDEVITRKKTGILAVTAFYSVPSELNVVFFADGTSVAEFVTQIEGYPTSEFVEIEYEKFDGLTNQQILMFLKHIDWILEFSDREEEKISEIISSSNQQEITTSYCRNFMEKNDEFPQAVSNWETALVQFVTH